MADEWKWYAGTSDEFYSLGPFDTREEAIEAGRDDSGGEFKDENGTWMVGINIVEAINPPLRLADYIGADDIMDRANDWIADSDRVGADGDDGPWFECTPEQEKDLAGRLKRLCDEWQAEHGLVFTCRTFANDRNRGYVVVDHPYNKDAA